MFTKIYYKTKEILIFILNIFKYIITFIISFIFVFFLRDIFKFNDDIGFSLALIMATSLFLLLLKREKKSPFKYLKIHKVNLKTILQLICFTIILVPVDLGIVALLRQTITTNVSTETQLYFWSVLHLVILAPISEEIFFRGILFQKLKEIMPLFLSLIIQGFIFGISHGALSCHLIQSIVAGLSGILYALVYNYKKNLTIPILLHSFYNSFLVILNLLFPNF
ncbi:type II CAAX endopeptidase family protein [uncultured Clostridium sp.]|uniref:CPBP family intramembrane glutamic endopeptidase n=1 Tax=uncultured Clostridium sp. TaxID=59620 RepID=UPI00280B2C8A|nr:type II CAAX endopeptidase family protein [uncultured Clostridium sp.]